MSIIRFCQERADGGESEIYAYFTAGGKGSIRIGLKPEDHYPKGPREWRGDIIIPPDDFEELVARLLRRADYSDVEGVRDALDEVFDGVRDHEQELREQQTDPRSVVLSDEGRETIARLWLNGDISDDEAEELAGEDAFEEIQRAGEAVEEDVAWALEPGTAGRDDWEGTTPTDAGKSLFGSDEGLNERVEAEWIDETTPFKRIRAVVKGMYEPNTVREIADRARTSEETARKHLRHLAEDGFVEETSTRERGSTLYRRSPESLILEQAHDILDEVDDDALVSRIAEMNERIREYREDSGVESPEDAVLRDSPLDAERLRDWQTTRRNLGFAKVALALREAENTIAKDTDYE